MDQHVTYHPITDNLLRSYRYYVSGHDGAKVAADHCAAVAMDDALSAQFLGLLAHFAAPADRPFDQTHGFNIALTQGFFGPYFYINSGQLSTVGHAIDAYTQPWQQLVPGWDMVATAQNHVLSRFSSGVFIPANRVAALMSDAHTMPELAQALATAFPGEKLDRLWSALLYAHNAGAGLLEAASVVEPNAADLSTSVCFTNFAHCDQAGLQLYCQQPAGRSFGVNRTQASGSPTLGGPSRAEPQRPFAIRSLCDRAVTSQTQRPSCRGPSDYRPNARAGRSRAAAGAHRC